MARARNIKPGFFINDDLAEIEPMGRLLFIGLWTIADREGRLEDRPKRIKGQIFPYDNCDIESLLNDLEKWGFIKRYEGQKTTGEYVKTIQVINFKKHQNPHVNEKASELLPFGNTITVPEPETMQLSLDFDNANNDDRISKNFPQNNIVDNVDKFVENYGNYEETLNSKNLDEFIPTPDEIREFESFENSTVQVPYKHSTNPAESSTLKTESNNTFNKVVENRARACENSDLQKLIDSFSKSVHPILNSVEKNTLIELLNTYGAEWCLAAIEETGLQNGKTIKYTMAILQRWEKQGFKSDNRKKKTKTKTKTQSQKIATKQFVELAPSSQLEKGLIAIQKLRAERNMQVVAV